MTASEIRFDARTRLQGLWATLVPIWFIYLLIMMGAHSIFGLKESFFGTLISLVIGGPMLMGITRIFLKIYNKEPFELGQLFDGFKEFSRVFTAYLLMCLYILLWALLLIVPGIIAALGYSMTFFIMADHPEMPASEALRNSKDMMMGHKSELFWLLLSFIGWAILATIPFGIGWLWLESYILASMTIFYHKVKGHREETVTYQPVKEETIEVKDENL